MSCEQQEKLGEAIKEYKTFLDTGKHADFISGVTEDPRTRLAALRRMKFLTG